MDDTLPQPPAESAGLRPTTSRPVLWILAFLFFPYGPFIYLAYLGALRPLRTAVLLIASAAVHVGFVYILAKTNHHPWQPVLGLVMGLSFYILGMMQYWAGRIHDVWGDPGLRLWHALGWFFGLMLLANLVLMIALFHIAPSRML